jgi:hypothetical protein
VNFGFALVDERMVAVEYQSWSGLTSSRSSAV